jgi:hypothetical protein
MGECAERLGFTLDFIEPGKPSQNGRVESSYGRPSRWLRHYETASGKSVTDLSTVPNSGS